MLGASPNFLSTSVYLILVATLLLLVGFFPNAPVLLLRLRISAARLLLLGVVALGLPLVCCLGLEEWDSAGLFPRNEPPPKGKSPRNSSLSSGGGGGIGHSSSWRLLILLLRTRRIPRLGAALGERCLRAEIVPLRALVGATV